MRIQSIRRSLLGAILIAILTLNCSDKKSTDHGTDNGGPADLPGGDELFVYSGIGATLTTADGVVLDIGPGALPTDTLIELVAIEPPTLDGRFVAGARMEPEGLVLDSAVLVRLPLPADWEFGDTPVVYEFKGNDPSRAVPMMAYARLSGTAGAYFAEVLVSHFSGIVCAENCHAGTIEHVLADFQSRGCDPDSVIALARRQFPGVNIPDAGCGKRGVETAQAFLDTYFEDIGGYNAGQDVPPSLMQQLIDYTHAGRKVVLAFKPGNWGQRSGTNNFLPTSELEFSHTAALEVHNGQVQIRNSLATSDTTLTRILGGNTVWYPAEDLNVFRGLPQGVAAELQACGSPDCLSDPTRNEYGVAPMQPINGVGFVGRVWSDPWTYILGENVSWSGIPPRGVPWTAVRVYVERLDGPQSELCQGLTGNILTGSVSLPGRSGAFVPLSIYAGFGEYNSEPGFPAVEASTDPTMDQTSMLNYEHVLLFFGKTLIASNVYQFSDGSPGFQVILVYSTPNITDDDTGYPTTFVSVSGTMTLNEFGTAPGSRLRGTFTANLSGDRTVRVGDDFQYQTITGTMSGTVDVVLSSGDPISSPPK